MSGGMAWTIRRDSLELWRGLVLLGMGEVDFNVFWKYWKLTSSPNTSKLFLWPPDWSSFWKPGHQIKQFFPEKRPSKKYFPGTWTTSQNLHFLTKWLIRFPLFLGPMPLFFLAPWGPGPHGACITYCLPDLINYSCECVVWLCGITRDVKRLN